ncbi:MAG: MBL fold metallo-hydrolase [Anaeromyxobacter sp.]
MDLLEAGPGIFLVDTHYTGPRIAAAYVVRGDRSAAIVETGVSSSVPRILATLDALGVAREAVSHVVVTHVHLDHAGGAGALVRALPRATLVAHPKGARHLVDPAKLIAGSIAVYGEERYRAIYGELVPVPRERVLEPADGASVDLGGRTLTFLDAPGHARHHFVVVDDRSRGVFTGDAFGLSYRQADGPRGPFFFPTTTPVQLDPPALHATFDRILAQRPERLYLTHFGAVTGDLAAAGAALHRLLDGHVAVARAAPAGEGRHAAIVEGLGHLLLTGLSAQRSPLGRDEALRLYGNDLELNAQGLEVWMDSASHTH